MIYATPEAERALALHAVLDAGVRDDARRALIAEDGDGRLTATIVRESCSDGMSDRAYGLGVSVILEGGGPPTLATGCCSVGGVNR